MTTFITWTNPRHIIMDMFELMKKALIATKAIVDEFFEHNWKSGNDARLFSFALPSLLKRPDYYSQRTWGTMKDFQPGTYADYQRSGILSQT